MSLIHVDVDLNIHENTTERNQSFLIDTDNAPFKKFKNITFADYYILSNKKDILIIRNETFPHKMYQSVIKKHKPVLIISKSILKDLMKKI